MNLEQKIALVFKNKKMLSNHNLIKDEIYEDYYSNIIKNNIIKFSIPMFIIFSFLNRINLVNPVSFVLGSLVLSYFFLFILWFMVWVSGDFELFKKREYSISVDIELGKVTIKDKSYFLNDEKITDKEMLIAIKKLSEEKLTKNLDKIIDLFEKINDNHLEQKNKKLKNKAKEQKNLELKNKVLAALKEKEVKDEQRAKDEIMAKFLTEHNIGMEQLKDLAKNSEILEKINI